MTPTRFVFCCPSSSAPAAAALIFVDIAGADAPVSLTTVAGATDVAR
jgi:hypothetical protein